MTVLEVELMNALTSLLNDLAWLRGQGQLPMMALPNEETAVLTVQRAWLQHDKDSQRTIITVQDMDTFFRSLKPYEQTSGIETPNSGGSEDSTNPNSSSSQSNNSLP